MKTEDEIKFFLHFGYFPNYAEKVKLDYSNIDRNKYNDVDEPQLIQLAAQALKNSVSQNFKSGRHIVPLSGGLDSRAILAALLEHTNAASIETYTFGTPGTLDFDIGCMIAQHAGTKHTAIPLNQFEWGEEELFESAKRFDAQTLLFHQAPISILGQFADGITWSGYIGDAVSGGHLKQNPAKTLNEAKNCYCVRRRELRSIDIASFETFTPYLRHAGPMMSKDEQILFAEIGSFAAPHVLMDGFEYRTPLINSPFFDFFMSISNRYRYKQNLFKKMVLQTWPELFSLPCKNAYGLTLNAPTPIRLVKRAVNKIHNHSHTHLMTNFFDFDRALQRKSFNTLVQNKLNQFRRRNIFNIENPQGDALKMLVSLEVNLQLMEQRQRIAA